MAAGAGVDFIDDRNAFPRAQTRASNSRPINKTCQAWSAAPLASYCSPCPRRSGSTSGALREYKQGNYDQALKDYQKLLQRNAEDPRLHFNAGARPIVTKNSIRRPKNSMPSHRAGPQAQELSYYNHGNTLFQLGAQNPDPTKKTETWKVRSKILRAA